MSSFRLQSGDAGFNSRVDALFASLQTAAVDLQNQPQVKRPHEDDSEERHTTPATGEGDRHEFRHTTPATGEGDRHEFRHTTPATGEGDRHEFRHTTPATGEGDSDRHEFRRPRGVPLSWRGRKSFGPRNSTPDYVKNPQKWTRYSMKDTKVLNDRENAQVGLKLIDELRTRKMQDGEKEENELGNEGPKIMFKKPTKLTGNDEETEDDSNIDSSVDALFGGVKKLKKTEYVVGQSKQHKVKKATSVRKVEIETETTDKQIKLGHLAYEEEEEEEDE